MLLKTHHRSPQNLTFSKELSYLKYHNKLASNISKNNEYFKLMSSILNLLLNSYPKIGSQIEILKQSLQKWYEHIEQQSKTKNRELMNMKDELTIFISKQIGVTLEQIGYYVKYLTQRYQDEDMKILYVQYLNAIRKLQWDNVENSLVRTKNQLIQTESQYNYQTLKIIHEPIPTLKSINKLNINSNSEETIDSPFKQRNELQKFIKIKEENLDLERKINQLSSRIQQLQSENKSLKQELDRVFDQNQQFRLKNDKSLDQIRKLKNLLNDIKNQEQINKKRLQQQRMQFTFTQNKYDHLQQIKLSLFESLQNAEQEILKKQQANSQSQQQKYLRDNYIITPIVSNEDKFKTVKKEAQLNQFEDDRLRMMLLQAIALESFLDTSVDFDK